MNLLQAAALGLVQGITEFLPISSTAHLRIVPALFHWPDPGAAYSAIIQLGTSAAVILYFWKDLERLTVGFFKSLSHRSPFETQESRLAWFVILGTIPVGICGLLFKKAIETQLRSLYIIAASEIGLALVLFVAERTAAHVRTVDQMKLRDGLAIGGWQALALIPGSSRSGTTLTGGLLLGLRREDAARYSFLLSIPATTLAGLYELKNVFHAADRPSNLAMAVGTLVAFIFGMAAIAGLLRYLRHRTTWIFIVYRLGLGILLLVLLGMGILEPKSGLEPSLPPAARQLHS